MARAFPDVRLGTLQRRRRLLRSQPAASAGITLGLLALNDTRFDPKNFEAVVVGDLQSPFHDERALSSFNYFLKDMAHRINVLIDNGDHYDNYAISAFHKDKGRGTPEAFAREIEIGTNIFREWREILGEGVDIILHRGNHEDRWDRYLTNPNLDHLYAVAGDKLDFADVYGLNELGVIVVPYMQPVLYGEVVVTHGTTSSKKAGVVALAAIQQKYARSVILNHVHTGAMVTQRYLDRTCVGVENFTLCRIDDLGYAEYPNWSQGFSYVKTVDGATHIQPVMMNNQSFVFDGKLYTPEGVK
jgi:hypothetical protein